MKSYQCDQCGKEGGSQIRDYLAPVTLKGVTGSSGGILLPELAHEKHFCSTACFWKWVKRYDPDNDRV